MNYYEILEVDRNASIEEIKKAYARKIKIYTNETHPEEFQRIREAFDVLKNLETRETYNRQFADNGHYQMQMNMVNVSLEKGQYNGAKQILETMYERYPEDLTVLYMLTNCYLNLEYYDKAINLLKNEINIVNTQEDLLVMLAMASSRSGDTFNAKKHYEKLISMNPLEPNYYFGLSNIMVNEKKYTVAMSILEKKFQHSPPTMADYPILSEIYFIAHLNGNQTKANETLNRIKKLAKFDFEKQTLIEMILNECEDIDVLHPGFEGIVYLVKDLNNNNNLNVTQWVNDARDQILSERAYEVSASADTYSSQTYSNNNSETDSGGGSLFWAIIIGIIVSFIGTPILGIVAGFVYFFWGKQILQALGCLIAILVVGGFIFMGIIGG